MSRYKNSSLKGHASDLSGKGVLSGTTCARDEEPNHDLKRQPGVEHSTPSKQPPGGLSGIPYYQQWYFNLLFPAALTNRRTTGRQVPVQPSNHIQCNQPTLRMPVPPPTSL